MLCRDDEAVHTVRWVILGVLEDADAEASHPASH